MRKGVVAPQRAARSVMLRLCWSAGPIRTETAAWDAGELASYPRESWRPGVPLPCCLNHCAQPTSLHERPGDHARHYFARCEAAGRPGGAPKACKAINRGRAI